MVSSNVEGNIENKSVFCIFVTFLMDPNWKTIVKTRNVFPTLYQFSFSVRNRKCTVLGHGDLFENLNTIILRILNYIYGKSSCLFMVNLLVCMKYLQSNQNYMHTDVLCIVHVPIFLIVHLVFFQILFFKTDGISEQKKIYIKLFVFITCKEQHHFYFYGLFYIEMHA